MDERSGGALSRTPWELGAQAVPSTCPPLAAQGVRTRLDGEEKRLALTFDDGPDPTWTPAVLEILRRAQMPATFFLLAERALAHPDVVREIVANGHQVGVHAWSHLTMRGMPDAARRRQISAAKGMIEGLADLSGLTEISVFRPPYGDHDPALVDLALELGMSTWLWSIDVRDWVYPPVDVMRRHIEAHLHPGAVLLLHDGRGWRAPTLQLLAELTRDLHMAGWKAVPLV
jgi:peptidoglycan/xylan/chitin deacetylase (PgdA/CDA1 family)